MANTDIQWTNKTWNPIAGCSEISPACEFCYAKYMAHRLAGIAHSAKKYEGTTRRTQGGKTQWTGKINFDEEALLLPLKWKKGVKIFVNSMSDLFHDNVPFEWLDKLFAVMSMCKQHTFQVLTKRTERMREYTNSLKERVDYILSYIVEMGGTAEQVAYAKEHIEQNGFLPNVWLGCTVENQETANERIPHLLACPAKVRFLSCEPLLGKLDIEYIYDEGSRTTYYPLNGKLQRNGGKSELTTGRIDWVITGGESGNAKGVRPSHPDWFRSIRDQCEQAGVAYFHKQNGAYAMCDDAQANELTNVGHILTQYNRATMRSYGFDIQESGFHTLYDENGKESKTLCYECDVETPKLVVRVKDAGNFLDGKQHLEFPNV